MPPNDLVTELRTGEREQMSEEELEMMQSKLEEEANQQGMIWTLDAIKKEMDEVAGQWNGDEGGKLEEDAQVAKEALEKVEELENILKELGYTVTTNYNPL